jgi:hypothetical protein
LLAKGAKSANELTPEEKLAKLDTPFRVPDAKPDISKAANGTDEVAKPPVPQDPETPPIPSSPPARRPDRPIPGSPMKLQNLDVPQVASRSPDGKKVAVTANHDFSRYSYEDYDSVSFVYKMRL